MITFTHTVWGLRLLSSLLVLQLVEGLVNQLVQVVEFFRDFSWWQSWHDKLHSCQLVDNSVRKFGLNVAHRDLLLLSRSRFNHSQATFVELDDGLHHAHSLHHWAVVIFLREGVLLQEFILDDSGSLNGLVLMTNR